MDPFDVAAKLCPPALKARFGVTRLLGRGGMGAVFEGVIASTGKPCAVKVLLENPGRTARERLLQEAQLLSRFRHPNLVEVYETGEDQGRPWIAMELVDGGDLSESRGGALGAAELGRIAEDVAGVLDELHSRGILHRDIKPQNLMRTREGRTIVMDLGLARDLEQTRQTATGALVGTLLYLAPEMLLKDQQGPAIDWYALGMTLYILMHPDKPYTGERILGMTAQGRWSPPPPLPPRWAGTPVGELCRRLMAPDPTRRLRGAAAVRGALSDAAAVPGSRSAAVPALRGRSGRLRPLALGAGTLALGVGLGVFLGGGRGPAPPPGDSPGAGDAATAWRPAAAALGEPRADPVLVLDAALRGADPAARAAAVAALADRAGPRAEFLRFRAREARREHAALDAQVAALAGAAAPEDYFEARLRVEGLGRRWLALGARGTAAAPAEYAVLREDAAGLEGALRDRPEVWAQAARLELWDMAARRAAGRPRVSLPALEFARKLAAGLRPRLGEAEPFVAWSATLATGRALAALGELRRFDRLAEVDPPRLLAGLENPAFREVHRADFLFPRKAHQVPGGVFSPQRLFEPTRGTTRLPEVAGAPGLAGRARPVRPALVPDPAPRPVLRKPGPVAAGGGEGEVAAVLSAARREADLTDAVLKPRAAWVDAATRVLMAGPAPQLAEALARAPGALRALKPGLEAAKRHELYGRLLRGWSRSTRTAQGYLRENRRWYSGPPAEVELDRVALEFRQGNRDRGRRLAAEFMREFARLTPPFSYDEFEVYLRALKIFDRQMNYFSECEEPRLRYLTAAARYLEALAAARPGPDAPRAARDAWEDRLRPQVTEWYYRWARRLGRPDGAALSRVGDRLQRVVAGIRPGWASLVEKKIVEAKGDRVRQTLAAHHECDDAWAAAIPWLPDDVFADPPGDLLERFFRAVDTAASP